VDAIGFLGALSAIGKKNALAEQTMYREQPQTAYITEEIMWRQLKEQPFWERSQEHYMLEGD
jgi:hypothetical protein